MKPAVFAEEVVDVASGRWSVVIIGDEMPMESGLSRRAASRRAHELMDELSQGIDEWDCYCNVVNGDASFVLFRMVKSVDNAER